MRTEFAEGIGDGGWRLGGKRGSYGSTGFCPYRRDKKSARRGRPERRRASRCWARVRAGRTSRLRQRSAIATMVDGADLARKQSHRSGVMAINPRLARRRRGKCRRLKVRITRAPDLIAPSRICASAGSSMAGKVRSLAGRVCSNASGQAEARAAKRLPICIGVTSGRARRNACSSSNSTSSDQ